MYTAQDLINSFAWETTILKHLAQKIPADSYDWKPQEGMRSFRELLEYTARMGTSPIKLIQEGYNPETMKQLRLDTEARDVTSEYDELLDEQFSTMKSFLESTTEEYMNEEIEVFGSRNTRKGFFLEMAVKNFPAYRMQLFHYLKSGLGMSDLNTANLWQAKDAA